MANDKNAPKASPSGKTEAPAVKPEPAKTDAKAAKPAIKDMFAEYAKADAAYKAALEATSAASVARSAIVKDIQTHYGSGPFNFGGAILTVYTRKVRDEKGEVVESQCYFKNAGGTVQVVE